MQPLDTPEPSHSANGGFAALRDSAHPHVPQCPTAAHALRSPVPSSTQPGLFTLSCPRVQLLQKSTKGL